MTVERNWTYAAALQDGKLGSVVDGDTVKLVLDLGFYTLGAHSIRLKDVNTPEIFTKDEDEKQKGLEAKVRTQDWFMRHMLCGYLDFPYLVVTQKDRQTFNRYIGDILCADCGNHLNEYLRAFGYC